MSDLTAWIMIGGLALIVVCIFSLSNQIHRNLHFILQVMDSNNKALLERLAQLAARPAGATTTWPGVERRVAQRRSPMAQMVRHEFDVERRISPGRRQEDFAAARAAGMLLA